MGALGSSISVAMRECFAKRFSAAQYPMVFADCWLLCQSRRAAAGVRRTMPLVLENGSVRAENQSTAGGSRPLGRGR